MKSNIWYRRRRREFSSSKLNINHTEQTTAIVRGDTSATDEDKVATTDVREAAGLMLIKYGLPRCEDFAF